jgi:hypothetical protein
MRARSAELFVPRDEEIIDSPPNGRGHWAPRSCRPNHGNGPLGGPSSDAASVHPVITARAVRPRKARLGVMTGRASAGRLATARLLARAPFAPTSRRSLHLLPTKVSGSVEHILRDGGWEFGVVTKAEATAG